MGLLSPLLRRRKGVTPAGPDGTSWMAGYIPTGSADRGVTPNASYADMVRADRGYVYSCANFRARKVASAMADVELWSVDGEFEARYADHPFLELWRRPNNFLTAVNTFWYTGLSLGLTGNAFWAYEFDRLGIPRRIWALPPHQTYVVPHPTDYISGYVLKVGREALFFDAKEVTHFRYPNPNSIWYGLGPVEASWDAVKRQQRMSEFWLSTFDNRAVPGLVLETDEALSKDDMSMLTAVVETGLRGTRNANRALLLSHGLKASPLTRSLADLDFMEGADHTEAEIRAAFGIHPHHLGEAGDINRANAEAAEYGLAVNVVQPELEFMGSTLDLDLMPLYPVKGRARLEVRFASQVPEDRDAAMKEAAEGYRSGVFTRAEARGRVGESPRDGDDVYAVPFNVVLEPAGESDEAELVVEDDPAEDATPENRALPVVARRALPASVDKGTVASKLRGRPDKDLGKLRAKCAKALAAIYRKQRKRTLGRLTNEVRSIRTQAVEQGIGACRTLSERARRAAKIALDRTKDIFDEADDLDDLSAAILPFLEEAAKRGIATAADILGVDIDLDPDVEVLADRAGVFAELVNRTTAGQVAEALAAALANEASADEVREAVEHVFDVAEGSRATLASRAETSRAYGEAQGASYEAAGVEGKEWVTAGDDAVEEACLENEGAGTIPLAEPFPTGDLYAPTDVHPQCRCAVAPALMDDEREASPYATRRISDIVKAAVGTLPVPQVTVEVAAARPPDVVVHSAPITVQAAPAPHVDVHLPTRTVRTVERDEDGEIVRVIEEAS